MFKYSNGLCHLKYQIFFYAILFLLMLFEVPFEIGIVRQFPFSSSAQCMSVITRTLGASYMTMFTKGAPEKVQNMCLPQTGQ